MQNYKEGIYIPPDVCLDKLLNDGERFMYGYILKLSNNEQKVCYATDSWFSNLLGVCLKTITRRIERLITLGYVQRGVVRVYDKILDCLEIVHRFEGVITDTPIQRLDKNVQIPHDFHTPVDKFVQRSDNSVPLTDKFVQSPTINTNDVLYNNINTRSNSRSFFSESEMQGYNPSALSPFFERKESARKHIASVRSQLKKEYLHKFKDLEVFEFVNTTLEQIIDLERDNFINGKVILYDEVLILIENITHTVYFVLFESFFEKNKFRANQSREEMRYIYSRKQVSSPRQFLLTILVNKSESTNYETFEDTGSLFVDL